MVVVSDSLGLTIDETHDDSLDLGSFVWDVGCKMVVKEILLENTWGNVYVFPFWFRG